ncbi:transcriptional regulator [Streptococcus sp. HMSC073F11]|jgi:prophage sa05, DNA-binding protein|uniref:helix-turn-helix transcriptional regulator n=1 Tax=Streptococcus sp. HMSC073F11 TaxID=1739268 RepID=UPI0008A2B4F4|nr:helix-turn-helix transcriptional regulator [Streptococcus sp. HMSC073F11]OFL52240.1 transcriptional regulator [Streptococcus sp. HMSC073F11]
MSTIKNRLKILRTDEGITQDELAQKINEKLKENEKPISKMVISNWENNKHTIKPDKAQLLADHFGVSVGHLLGYEDNFIETVKELSQKDGSEEAFFKAFRAYYELKIADGKEDLLTLKDEDFLSKYREEILKSLIPNFNELSNREIKKYLSDDRIINEADQKLNDFLFTLGTLNPQETQLLVDFISLSHKDKQIVLNLLKSLSDK